MKKIIFVLIVLVFLSGCSQNQTNLPIQEKLTHPIIDRFSVIPTNATKMNSEIDLHPPVLHSDDYYEPVALPYPVNSAGAEDGSFIPLGKNELYFFFTPDVTVPMEKQVLDNVTGMYVTRFNNNTWSVPERVWLIEPGKLSLDGCVFVEDNIMWFCAAREGYTGMHWFSAEYINDSWTNFELIPFNVSYDIGELHRYEDELYFHSPRSGGLGGYDMWMSKLVNDSWQEPTHLAVLSSVSDEGWPYISSDGLELWFTRFYQGTTAIFKSVRVNGSWQIPELIISSFAGEPTFDSLGNLYFIHHYFNNSVMIEADVYVARKK